METKYILKQCLDKIPKEFCLYIDLTTWPNLTKFCSLTLSGASPPHPLVNACTVVHEGTKSQNQSL